VESADSRDEQNKVKVPRGNNTPFVLRQKLCGSGIGVPVGINAYQSKNENNDLSVINIFEGSILDYLPPSSR